ncbi:MAG: pyridoxal phosphate-dependent aminotransferase [Rhodothermia bacterium]
MKPLSDKTQGLTQSGIRAITKLVNEVEGINLGQGICDMPTPSPIKEAAKQAIDADKSIYTPFAGIRRLQEALLDKAGSFNRLPCTSRDEIMVSAGSTGAFVTAIFSLLDPGDEIILFEPYYGYHVNIIALTGATVRTVQLKSPAWDVDFDELREAIGPRTKAVLLNTPTNPTGKVWRRDELETLLAILIEYDLFAITDEIYEYMVYDGGEHVSLASLPGAYERTITISGFSKTYNMTGWRLGYAVGPTSIIEPMGLLNDLFYICAPSPLQHGILEAFEMPDSYFDHMLSEYDKKRTMICETLEDVGFDVTPPAGSYYVFAGFRALRETLEGFEDDMTACETLIRQTGVATIPGRSFFDDPEDGRLYLRFCYAKEFDVLEDACLRLRRGVPAIARSVVP